MRHDAPRQPRRITPGTISFYVRYAHRLRAEAYRSTMFDLWAWLTRMFRER